MNKPIEQIKTITNALISEVKPINKALFDIYKVRAKTQDLQLDTKVNQLLTRLTYSNKRKTTNSKYNGHNIGLNNNGLGIVSTYGNILEPLSDWGKELKNNPIIKISKDTNACFDISENVLNKYKTKFIQLTEKLRNDFEVVSKEEKNINGIKIFPNGYNYNFDDNSNKTDLNNSDLNINNLSFEDLKTISKIAENKDEILNHISEHKDKLENNHIKLSELTDFVDSLLKPILALENL